MENRVLNNSFGHRNMEYPKRSPVIVIVLIALVGWMAATVPAFAEDAVRVQAILASDRNGGGAPSVTPQQILASLTSASRVFASAGIVFTFDPASDVLRIKSDLLYQDCALSPTADLNAPREVPPDCDTKPNNDERNRIAQLYPGKLVGYF